MACRILCRKAAEDADLNCCAVIDLRAVEPGEDGVRPHDTRKVDCVDLIGGGATLLGTSNAVGTISNVFASNFRLVDSNALTVANTISGSQTATPTPDDTSAPSDAGSAPAEKYFVMKNLAERVDELVAAKAG